MNYCLLVEIYIYMHNYNNGDLLFVVRHCMYASLRVIVVSWWLAVCLDWALMSPLWLSVPYRSTNISIIRLELDSIARNAAVKRVPSNIKVSFWLKLMLSFYFRIYEWIIFNLSVRIEIFYYPLIISHHFTMMWDGRVLDLLFCTRANPLKQLTMMM